MNPGTIRVLLSVEPHTVRWGLLQLLDSHKPDMEVVGATGANAEALALARTMRPDVIVLGTDLGMRRAIELIPGLCACCGAKILLVTGVRDDTLVDAAIIEGACGIIRKDMPAETVLRAIVSVHRGELWLDRITIARVLGAQYGRDRGLSADQNRIALLTPKERVVVTMVAQASGVTNKELAKLLFMNEHTLRNHLSSIYQKLEVNNRLMLYIFAVRNGFAHPVAQ